MTHTFRVAHKSHCGACERASRAEGGREEGFHLARPIQEAKERGRYSGVGAKACKTTQPNIESRGISVQDYPAKLSEGVHLHFRSIVMSGVCSLAKTSTSVMMINHLLERGSNFSINIQIEVFFRCSKIALARILPVCEIPSPRLICPSEIGWRDLRLESG